MSSNC